MRKAQIYVSEKYNADGVTPGWDWLILIPQRFVVRPPEWRTYASSAAARRAAEKVARDLGLIAAAGRNKEVRS